MTALPKLRALPLAKVSPDDMLIFAAVARHGGIRAGAQALRAPRSTVSRRLAELERTLGGQLVTRSTRRFTLTDLGAALLQKCTELEQLLQSTDLVTARAANEPSGTLTIAASPAVGEEFLPDVIAAYARRFPKVKLAVNLGIDFVDLGKGAADVAIRTGPLAEKTDLFATRLGGSVKGHYASRAYLKARGTPHAPDELAQHDCIVIAEGPRSGVWAFRAHGAEVHVSVQGTLRVNNHRLARSAAIAGLGIARLPGVFARAAVDEGELVPVLEQYWPRTELFAVHTAGHPAPPKIRAFIELLKAEMKPRLQQQ